MAKNLISVSILAQIWAKKLFSWVLPLLDVQNCSQLFLYEISRKTNESNLQK